MNRLRQLIHQIHRRSLWQVMRAHGSQVRRTVLLALAVPLLSCGQRTAPTAVEDAASVRITSVVVTPEAVAMESLGDTVALHAIIKDANGRVITDRNVQWSSSDSRVATVNSEGVVRAVGNGFASITGRLDGLQDESLVTVEQIATRLAFLTEPRTTWVGASVMPSVDVAVQDAGLSLVTNGTKVVSLVLGSNSSAGTLLGTTTVSSVNGVAHFSGLTVDAAGDGYTLFASATGMAGAASDEFDVWATPAHITHLDLPETTVAIGGGWVPYTLTVSSVNPDTLYPIVVQTYLDQGTTSRAAGGTGVDCGTNGDIGKLPPGMCTFDFTLSASDDGTLFPGSATARFVLKDAISSEVIDVITADVTLIAFVPPPLPQVSLDGVALASTTVTIGGWITYDATVTNAETQTVGGLTIQGWVEQGSAKRAAGGAMLHDCGGSQVGELPPGTCTLTQSLVASNASSGTGTLVAGPASARIELWHFEDGLSRLLDEVVVSVTLAN